LERNRGRGAGVAEDFRAGQRARAGTVKERRRQPDDEPGDRLLEFRDTDVELADAVEDLARDRRDPLARAVMSSDELTLFSYEVLGLVGRGAPGRTTCAPWCGAAESSTGPGRAATTSNPSGSHGWATARKEPGRTRERTLYTLTDKGLEALRDWARTPVSFTPIKSEVLVRILITDLVGEETTRASIATLREDMADLAARLAETEAGADRLPHRREYLLLVTGFLRRQLELHGAPVDEVERELKPPRRR
jgi:DNA-binding PadR family transcriptional regulator